MQISLYKNTFDSNFSVVHSEYVAVAILTGVYKQQVEHLRSLDEVSYKEQKKDMPAVTWSGVFTTGTRTIETIENYSGLVVIDIDKLEESTIETLKSQLSKDPIVYLCFVSPSNKGIKIVVKVNTGPSEHRAAFLHLEKYFNETYFVKVDKSGKDVSRLCYLSYDERAIYNESSEVFEVDLKYAEIEKAVNPIDVSNYKPLNDYQKTFDLCSKWVNNTKTYTDGEKNVYIHALACAMNRCGVPLEISINLITSNLPTPDIKWHQSVRSAYFHNQHEHGAVIVKDLNSTQEFVAPPYIANYTDDVVKNDLMRITATMFHHKVSVSEIQDVVSKVAKYYDKEGFIDINRVSLPELMNYAISVLNQQVANQVESSALKYETAEDIGRKIVKMDLINGLVQTFVPEIDDAMYGGMMPGNSYGIIGLGGTYKSVFAQFVAFKNAINGNPVLYLNGEMSEFQFYERLSLMAFGIDLRNELYHKRLTEETIDSFIEQLKSFLQGNIFVFNGSGFNQENLISTISHIEATSGKKIKLIIGDGLTQFDSKGKEEIPATIFNAGICKEVAKLTNTVIMPLIHLSGDAAAYTLRDTGMKVRGGIKTLANLDGYFSTSLLIDPQTTTLENLEEVVYLTGKLYLRLKDKRTRAGVVPTIVNITKNLHLEQEMVDPRSYELSTNRK